MDNTKRYLYNCYCGPVRLREDQKDKHPGFLYENCPRISAPKIKAKKISEIKDGRVKKFYNNLDQYIDILKQSGVNRANFIGSFVRGHQSANSDIDIEIFGGPELQKDVSILEREMFMLDNISFDISPHSQLVLMPHMKMPKGDRIVIFSIEDRYTYSELDNFIWTE
jgi:predicted nucleotidyltransferase